MTDGIEKRKKNAHGPTVNALKRAKFEAKQERRRQQAALEQQQSTQLSCAQQWRSWFDDRKDYAAFVTKADVLRIKELKHKQRHSAESVCSAEDERLRRIASWIEPFFDLKGSDTVSATQHNNEERVFISEGTESVRLMIQRCNTPLDTTTEATISPRNNANDESTLPPSVRVLSILCKPNTFFEEPVRLIDDVEKRISNNQSPFKIVIGNEDALSEIAGFNIARGALACGVVPTYFQKNGYEWLLNKIRQQSSIRILALDAVCDTANLGSIIRTAAALSIDAVILSDDSCDAFYRQSVRVSMGHVINVPTLRVGDWRRSLNRDCNTTKHSGGLVEFITWLRDQMEIQCLAAVVDDESDDSQPPLVALESLIRNENKKSWCCVVGNEGRGIRNEVIKACNQRVKISMATTVDSLSLPVAAAILMHGLSQI